MTQEEKQLLLVDLCARLPYHPILHFIPKVQQDDEYLYGFRENGCKFLINDAYYIEEVKPYLRPMSSMTKEELKEFQKLRDITPLDWLPFAHDWLLSKHFDVRGLIPKGLAIEVTEENNPYE